MTETPETNPNPVERLNNLANATIIFCALARMLEKDGAEVSYPAIADLYRRYETDPGNTEFEWHFQEALLEVLNIKYPDIVKAAMRETFADEV